MPSILQVNKSSENETTAFSLLILRAIYSTVMPLYNMYYSFKNSLEMF